MSLLAEAAQMLRSELNNLGGFAVPIVVTTPSGARVEIRGFAADIAISIDPETGVPVRGRKASVAVSLADLESAGVGIPENIPEETQRPWLVTWKPTAGSEQTMKVSDALPDKLGIVVLLLEEHLESAYTGSMF